ncbi:hypothetical protein DFR24_2241 [Panacagrimonas perspica]|uniref:Uncharacterized protein n=2 Tax=Panacagrimonas perspica TaxID=381431 RepID=A0A4S3JZC1_9GAMM|nr:hypothetical protein [Panacagrimonas perspica]TDU32833.1 hypothetical protein DFR24_2241 [Panacagrimonas perspica]THD00949.1 hypothetical protein B1810_22070 [Panacagrimonas perspica]
MHGAPHPLDPNLGVHFLRHELSSLRDEIAERRPRTAAERVALQRRAVLTINRVLEATSFLAESFYTPGVPEYDTWRHGTLEKSFKERHLTCSANLRLDTVSRAAMMVWQDEFKVRRWMQEDLFPAETPSAPYWMARASDEGVWRSLEALDQLYREATIKDEIF